ncbi:MAG: AAA family ATPase [Mogibacterium sp.]|nr:AAA family ATPase [Mogibacterium sp.]
MNISKAKEQVKGAVRAYLTRDELGNYVIPVEKQRPLLLIGPPGIGKTAVMEQISSELGIGLISYSMTHHTRQSAIGLPFISRRNFGGREYDVTEYTMSEIIASVYELMEDTGVKEGILFLDEINCVSETLSPLMLQFLQYKVFGGHRIPEGWIIVTAGNPPEYNESAREFDVVTLDRLKKICVEPDYEAWKQYAVQAGIHPAVMSFLRSRRDRFYSVETTVSGKTIVTPRGWEDLSKMLLLYEKNGIETDEDLIVQYLQNERTAREFSVYLDLYHKYRTEYPIEEMLSGHLSEEMKDRIAGAGFDEVYTLIGLLLGSVDSDIKGCMEERRVLESVRSCLKQYRHADGSLPPKQSLDEIIDRIEKGRSAGMRARSLTREEGDRLLKTAGVLHDISDKVSDRQSYEDTYETVRDDYSERVSRHDEHAAAVRARIDNLFHVAEECWGDGKEMLLILTEMTADPDSVSFISTYGSEAYFRHNKSLLFNERDIEIEKEIEDLEL